MTKYSLRTIKNLIADGVAIDITNNREEMPERLQTFGFSLGRYGVNGKLLKGLESGKIYAIVGHCSNIYKYN